MTNSSSQSNNDFNGEYFYTLYANNGREVLIRPARPGDETGIQQLMAWFVEQTNCSWRYKPLTLEAMTLWLDEHLARPGQQVWVAVCDHKIVGYSSLSDFRAPEGYWHCAENSIYVLPSYAGQKIGQVLMQHILDAAAAVGLHRVVAAIDGDNEASIKFHERFGFRTCGVMPEVGWKNNQWLDLVLMLYNVPVMDP